MIDKLILCKAVTYSQLLSKMSNYYLTPPLQQTDYHQQTGYHHDLSHSSVQYQMQTTPTRTNEWQKSQETNPRIYVSAVNAAPYSYQQQGLLRQRPVVLAAAAHMPTPRMIHDPAVVRALLLLLDSMYTHCCGAHVNIHVQTHVCQVSAVFIYVSHRLSHSAGLLYTSDRQYSFEYSQDAQITKEDSSSNVSIQAQSCPGVHPKVLNFVLIWAWQHLGSARVTSGNHHHYQISFSNGP